MKRWKVGDRMELNEETIHHLFGAVTTRWRDEKGVLQIGIPRKKLEEDLGMSREEIELALDEVAKRGAQLGLQLVRYTFMRDEWFCMRSTYVLPTDMREEEMSLLGMIIALIEESGECDTKHLQDRVLRHELMTYYSLERALKHLEYEGFIKRKGKKVGYGPRTLIEIGEKERLRLLEHFKEFLL